LSRKKVIWHLNDTSMPLFIRLSFSFFSNFVDSYIFASERSKNYYKSLNMKNKPEFVIPAPVDTIDFDCNKKYNGDKELIKEWSDKIIIGTVANISPVKGLELFIKSAQILNKEINSIHFVVVGRIFKNQKKYYKSLIDLCKTLSVNNISFINGRNDIRPLLKRFNVYICSSKAESSPISVWEAMSMSKPIVSTDVGDVSKYVKNNYNGFIISDHKELAVKTLFFINNKDNSLKFGANSRKSAIDNLDIKICASKHYNAYSETYQNNEHN
jgi:glycosyltransferase involved in cell wall biosynthesis